MEKIITMTMDASVTSSSIITEQISIQYSIVNIIVAIGYLNRNWTERIFIYPSPPHHLLSSLCLGYPRL